MTIGGGINSIDAIRQILRAGADKVSINTAAIKNPDFIKEASDIFGAQCIVTAIDCRRNTDIKTIPTKPSWNSKMELLPGMKW